MVMYKNVLFFRKYSFSSIKLLRDKSIIYVPGAPYVYITYSSKNYRRKERERENR